MTLRPYLVYSIVPRGSLQVAVRVLPAPATPLTRGDASRYASAHLPRSARGYAYVHGTNRAHAEERFRTEWADWL